MTLTITEYEKCKKRLADAMQERSSVLGKRDALIESLKSVYNLTLEQAKEEVDRLRDEIAVMESDFAQKYKEFNSKWQTVTGQF